MTILGKPYGVSAIEVIPPVSSRGPARWQVRWEYYNGDGARRQASRKRFRNEEDCQTYITKALLPASKREHMLLADGKYIPITEGQTDQEETMASKSPVRDKILEYLKDKPAGYHMKVTSVARATRLTKQQVDACLGHMMRDMPELGIKRVTTGVYDYDPEAAMSAAEVTAQNGNGAPVSAIPIGETISANGAFAITPAGVMVDEYVAGFRRVEALLGGNGVLLFNGEMYRKVEA